MTPKFMSDPPSGKCALYDEAPGGGDPIDPNALCNRPLMNPAAWLANIYFHSDFDYMEVSHSVTTTITHAGVAIPALPPNVSTNIRFGWGTAFADHLLLQHDLGYAPFALVALGNNILWPGMPMQITYDGGCRFVTAYVTATQVRLYEWASTGGANLPAIAASYSILAFKNPPAPVGNIMFDFEPVSGVVKMGRDKFNSLRRYLQVVGGGSPIGLSKGRTIDLRNGAIRATRPDGSIFDPVPPIVIAVNGGTGAFGGSMAYNGSFASQGAVLVQAP